MDQESRSPSDQDSDLNYVEWKNGLGKIRYQPRRVDDKRLWHVSTYGGVGKIWATEGVARARTSYYPYLYDLKWWASFIAKHSYQKDLKNAWINQRSQQEKDWQENS